MNHIKLFAVAIGLCAFTQLAYSQTATQTDTTKTTVITQVSKTDSNTSTSSVSHRPSSASSVVSVGYSAPKNAYSSYNNYDFIPGDTVIFSDSFAGGSKTGKSSGWWNSAGAKGVAGVKVFAFTDAKADRRGHKRAKKGNAYLNDAFTLEFDNYSKGTGMPYVYFYKTTAAADAASNDMGRIKIGSPYGNEGINEIEYKNSAANASLTANLPDDLKGNNFLNKWHHIALAYKKGEIKVYVDQYKVMVIPNIGFAPRALGIESVTATAQKPVMIANFRVANGGSMNMLDKKFTDAKIITHGINFNLDKAIIKPESMGTLNMIAGIMKGNPDLKFEIDGHTDNTGTAAHNSILSQQRADEVKVQLVALGIDSSRLTTKGFGFTKPLSDNLSDEGKANNRRVEFVRLQ
jgi:OmpA-OmpF porin, OOP family